MSELKHYGIPGQKKGVRRWQNPDGSFNEEGKKRYGRIRNSKSRFKKLGKAAIVAALVIIGHRVYKESSYSKIWSNPDASFDDRWKIYSRVKIKKDRHGNKIDPIILDTAITNNLLKDINRRSYNPGKMPNKKETINRILDEYENYFKGV